MTIAGRPHQGGVLCVPGLGSLPEPIGPSCSLGKPLHESLQAFPHMQYLLVLMGDIRVPEGVIEVAKEGKT